RGTLSPTRPSSSFGVAVSLIGRSLVDGRWRGSGGTGRFPKLEPVSPSRERAEGERRSQRRRCHSHRIEDLRVPGAAAKISRQRLADVIVTRVDVAREQIGGRHYEPRPTEPALHCARGNERLLHLVQPPILGQPFDRDDLVTLGL